MIYEIFVLGHKTKYMKIDVDYMKVAEQVYYHVNPNTKMDVPNSAYILTEKWYMEWAIADTDLELFEWILKNKQ